MEAYLKRYGIELMKVKPYAGGMLYCLHTCIFDSSHSDNEAAIFRAMDGALSYQCFHNSCKGRTWAEARAKISGDNKLTEFIIGTVNSKSTQDELKKQTAANPKSSGAPPDKTQWGFAARLFPRIVFRCASRTGRAIKRAGAVFPSPEILISICQKFRGDFQLTLGETAKVLPRTEPRIAKSAPGRA